MTRLAFIGFGEVGQTFAAGLMSKSGGKDGVAVAAFDLKFDNAETRTGMMACAEALGVRAAADAADAARDASVVVSAVTAAAAGEVAAAAAGYLKPGQIFLDINSAAPNTKRTAAGRVAASGADYVEGAVMAAVAGPGSQGGDPGRRSGGGDGGRDAQPAGHEPDAGGDRDRPRLGHQAVAQHRH